MLVTSQNIATKLLEESPDNPNSMTDDAYEALVALIKQQGFLQPILVRPIDGTVFRIIDGHHRVRAAKELGMDSIPCVVSDKGPHEEILLRIAMNKLRGELDITGVGRAFKELHDAGWSTKELVLTGYEESEVADLLKAVTQNVDVAMTSAIEMPSTSDYDADDVEDAAAKLFELKLEFDNREDLKKVRRALKRAGGKTKDMSLGLLKILGEEKEKAA